MASQHPEQPPLTDGFGRTIRYIRLSVTDRCNFRCQYCRPAHGSPVKQIGTPKAEYLSSAEMVRLARLFVELGVRRIRLTGGEPLLVRDIVALTAQLKQIAGLEDLALSTNAHYLERYATALRQSGLQRINISLDSLIPERFALITRGGDLAAVLRGIEAAVAAGLHPVKINMVVMGGVNDDEIPAMVAFARDRQIVLRFIEAMPIGEDGRSMMGYFIPAEQIVAQIQSHFPGDWRPMQGPLGAGPARYHSLDGIGMDIGIISALSQHFCATCNRVRLTSQGEIVLCLGRTDRVSLRQPLRAGASDEEMKHSIIEAIRQKPESHTFDAQGEQYVQNRMMALGG